MAIKKLFLKYYRNGVTHLCVNCVASPFWIGSYFIGITAHGKCTHDKEARSEYQTPFIGVIGSIFYGLALTIASVYELCTSYNVQKRFWDLENMKAVGEFYLGFGQGLTMLCLCKYCRLYKQILQLLQAVVHKYESTASEADALEALRIARLQAMLVTSSTVCVATFCTTYRYWTHSLFDFLILFKTFAYCQTTLGMALLANIHRYTLMICYKRLRNLLTLTLERQHSIRPGDILSIGKDLEYIMETRSACYQLLLKINRFIQFALYPFVIFLMLFTCEGNLVTIVNISNGNLFALKDEYTYFTILFGVYAIVSLISCYSGGLIVREDKEMVSFISRCDTRRLLRKDIYKVSWVPLKLTVRNVLINLRNKMRAVDTNNFEERKKTRRL
ncbi:hypothetical protein Trydic_g20009 [Trypoxylus dichotomus]